MAQKQDANDQYPILYHLHGAGSVELFTKRDVKWTAQQNELFHSFPVIIVAPCDPSLFSMWADGKKTKTCTIVFEDIMPFIESKYNVDTTKRYLQGFSMGGFGAAAWAFKFQDMFRKVIIWDGALHDFATLTESRAFIAKNQFDDNPRLFDPWSPWKLTSKASDRGIIGLTPIFMVSGSMRATKDFGERFSDHLKALGANLDYIETEFPHSLKPFVEKHGQRAFAFLANDD